MASVSPEPPLPSLLSAERGFSGAGKGDSPPDVADATADMEQTITGSCSLGPRMKKAPTLHFPGASSLTKGVERVALWKQIEEKMEYFVEPRQCWPTRWRRQWRSKRVEWMVSHLGVEPEVEGLASEFDSIDRKMKMLFYTELVGLVVWSAAKCGREGVLRWLQDGRLWDPTDYDDAKAAIYAADSGGAYVLMLLLGSFDLQLPRTVALTYKKHLIEQLKAGTCGLTRSSSGTVKDDPRAPCFSCATLAANFLKVRSDVAREVMESVEESRQILLGSRDVVTVLPGGGEFPNRLDTIFISRMVEHSQGALEYADKQVWANWQADHKPLRTSKPSSVTLPPGERMSALIPAQADYFVFVYSGDWLANGGFLYLDSGWKPLCLNAVSFEPGDHAFRFGDVIDIGNTTALAENIESWGPVTVKELKKKGAEKYKWFGPHEFGKIPDIMASPEYFQDDLGGFAYLFPGDGNKVRFFPVTGSGELIKRGVVGWKMNAAQLSILDSSRTWRGRVGEVGTLCPHEHALGPCSTSSQIVQSVISWSWRDLIAQSMLCSGWVCGGMRDSVERAANKGRPVKFGRVLLPGPVHPNLLHAIAIAPCPVVLQTHSVRAIVGAAFRANLFYFAVDLMIELFSFILLWTVISGLKNGIVESEEYLLNRMPLEMQVCLVLLGLFTAWSMVVELVTLREYWVRAWMATYLSLMRASSMINLSLSIAVIACWMVSNSIETMMVITAWAFSLRLLKVISFMQAMETRSLGLAIAPILKSLEDSSTFLIIVLFVLLAFVCLFWGLSGTSNNYLSIASATYWIGFVPDFASSDDVITSDSEHNQHLKAAAFYLLTILVSVAIMNIFIGMITTYYTRYQDRVGELFTRTRAQVCLSYLLWLEGMWTTRKLIVGSITSDSEQKSQMEVWFCYQDKDAEVYHGEKLPLSDQIERLDRSMRNASVALEELRSKGTEEAQSLSARFEGLAQDLKCVQNALWELKEVPELN